MMAMQPELLLQPEVRVRSHNPYALRLLPPSPATVAAKVARGEPSGQCSCGRWDCHAGTAAAAHSAADADQSPVAVRAPPSTPCAYLNASQTSNASMAGSTPPTSATMIRPVLVNFKFGSRIFTSTFRVAPGDAVVVEWDDSATHIGLVAEVLPAEQASFAGEQLPLIRRARDVDMATFHAVRFRETVATQECQRALDTVVNGPCGVRVLDAEWLLDGSGVTLSLGFDGPADQLDAVHEVLQARLNCRVWLLTTADLVGLGLTA
jgi:hypothetical protein